jgi:hypothetical protein
VNEYKQQMRASMKQEKTQIEALGGKRHGGSGAAWSRKGDGRVNGAHWTDPGHALVEFKRTGKKQFTIKADEVEKIVSEAIMEGRAALFGIELNSRHYILMEQADYEELVFRAVRDV